MQHYIDQLLADMREIANNPPPKRQYPSDSGMHDPEALFDGVEEYLNAPEQKMSEIFGIEKIVFPPAEKLTQDQQYQLVKVFLEIWDTYHFAADFPEGLPIQRQYELLVQYLDHETVYTTAQNAYVHLEFCDYDPSSCPFGDAYCACKKYLEEEES